ncbi:acid protease [Coprinopsis marcescibilis]|uniref:Acid protease n=1 Tax=Coprinopsis marcescibilis TaxID=230819 RepID=A0A5C3KCN2_COPMA|nr:acid protease [Coprinopsis marcescibilis]
MHSSRWDSPFRIFLALSLFHHTFASPAPGTDSSAGQPLSFEEIARQHTRRTTRGIHLPIVKTTVPHELQRRDQVSAIGLGNFVDIAYSVLLTVGGVTTPLILDTGSSDLWLMSDTCTSGCRGEGPVALYPQATLESAGIDARLFYGDSTSGTSAFGVIGKDTVTLAGISLQEQYFAAINSTNTSLIDTGNTGIFGLGFPINSVIWANLFAQRIGRTQSGDLSRRDSAKELAELGDEDRRTRLTDPHYYSRFPKGLSGILDPTPKQLESRQVSQGVSQLFASFATIGPFVPRLVLESDLHLPMVTVTLQRNTIEVGGNVGMLSIGEMTAGVNAEDLTWVPMRSYSFEQGGLPAPPDSPTETYPIAMEVMIDDVYLDGERLPRSTISPPTIDLSALIDTGNSLIRGPEDVVQEIYARISRRPVTSRLDARFPCDEPHTLAFSIGGKLFPVDPRDFATQVFVNNVGTCAPTLARTDPPEDGGYLFSWSLGTPFLKSVVSSFYYGNLTYPSGDPPRIGFLSTVPQDADAQLRAAVASAARLDGNFPAVSVNAPTGTNVPEFKNGNTTIPGITTPTGSSSVTHLRSGAWTRTLLPFALSILFCWLNI